MNRTILTSIIAALAFSLVPLGDAVAVLKKGSVLPRFELKSTAGKVFNRESFSGPKPGIIFLFQTKKCRSCLKGLDQLQALRKDLGSDVLIVAIGKDDTAPLRKFATGLGLRFPVASGDKALFKTFSASLMPTTLMVGPDSQLIKVVQGGGRHVGEMLQSLAETQLQRHKPRAAQRLFLKASKSGMSVVAHAGAAYSQLKGGQKVEAEKSFRGMAASSDKQLALQGKEGLAEILFQQGHKDEALKMADQVLAVEPTRTMANLVKGKILHAKGQGEGAEKHLVLASADGSKNDFSWQKAEANLALGNLNMGQKKSSIALKSYKKAAKENPYFAEALSNQGVALQKMGQPEEALKVLQKLKRVNPSDRLVHSLLRQAQAAIAQKQDLERQKYIQSIVNDLVTRFKSQKGTAQGKERWTSPVGAVSILGFQNNVQGILMGRIGMEGLLKDELARELSKRQVSVVEREVIDKVLTELKLGSSDLANPKTRTKLGKITAAHVLATGSFYDAKQGSIATMRLVETETTDIFLALSYKDKKALNPTQLAALWADKIQAKIKDKFPLQGLIVKVKSNEVIINLGGRHAVSEGMVFNVLNDGEPIDLGDGEIEYDFQQVGRIEVTRVRNKLAFAKVLSKQGDWNKGQKITVVR